MYNYSFHYVKKNGDIQTSPFFVARKVSSLEEAEACLQKYVSSDRDERRLMKQSECFMDRNGGEIKEIWLYSYEVKVDEVSELMAELFA